MAVLTTSLVYTLVLTPQELNLIIEALHTQVAEYDEKGAFELAKILEEGSRTKAVNT